MSLIGQADAAFGLGFGLFFILMMVVVFGGIGLWIWMLVDAATTPEGWFRTGNKTTWILVVALASWIGALIYLFAARPTSETREQLRRMKAAGYVPAPPGYPGYPPYGGPPAPAPGWGGSPPGGAYGTPPPGWGTPATPAAAPPTAAPLHGNPQQPPPAPPR